MSQSQPNILLFLTDDHGAWALGANNNREIRSPLLDSLAREGANFRNAFTPCPVCSPARACLLTGRTPSQVGIHDWLGEHEQDIAERDWLEGEITLPELLHDAGYHCGLSGKWHLGRSHYVPRGFDWCFGLPGGQGDHRSPYVYHLNGQSLPRHANKTQLITDYALQFLEQAPSDKPFFLNVGYITTHSPYAQQEEELLALYEDATFEDIPLYKAHPWHKNEGLSNGEHDRETLRSHYANYYAAVSEIDRNVGRILEQLRQSGCLENTLVIYVSDHGCALGHHGFWGKGNSTRPLNMHETSLRVPLLMRWPGRIQPGTIIEHCVDHYDLFQFICSAAGATLPQRAYPGSDFSGLLQNPDAAWDDVHFGEYGDLRMIRTPHYKLVRRYPNGPDDLFDLGADPDETRNLALLPEYAETHAALLQRLEEWYAVYEEPSKSGLRVKELPRHNAGAEAWRDGLREARGLQVY
ncbi:MAG TPA: sulfatase-like hydrolase/transferase [Abditibacteriaceae bacterium]|jgi:arylsulfatase A-like enzyme